MNVFLSATKSYSFEKNAVISTMYFADWENVDQLSITTQLKFHAILLTLPFTLSIQLYYCPRSVCVEVFAKTINIVEDGKWTSGGGKTVSWPETAW